MIVNGVVKGFSRPKGFIRYNNKDYPFMESVVEGAIHNGLSVKCVLEDERICVVYGVGGKVKISMPKPTKDQVDYLKDIMKETKKDVELNLVSNLETSITSEQKQRRNKRKKNRGET